MKYFILSASALSLLAACGGGGSDSAAFSDRPEFASFAEAQTEGGDYRADGTVTSARYEVSSDGTVTITDGPDTERDAVAGLSFEDEVITALKVRDSNADITLAEENGDYMMVTDGYIIAATEDGGDVAIVGDTDQLGYNYQSYGIWQTGLNGTSGRAAAGSFGAETASSEMPDAGTASYYGESVGQVVTDGVDYATQSDVYVETDFEDVYVSSAGTYAYDPIEDEYVEGRSDLDFEAIGSLDGSGFNAEIADADMAGDVAGQFYGPGAEEVGGTFSAVTDDSAYLGSFGASQ
ncbi:hypothetical protein AYJ57_21400 (plasmid) [Salipiger sp. CCB-MM3]|uniref:transferrin-binding protein-like solute binding protein n=1 Tax=Salipiger sp. CCB-MM3 TaxID=1792508 RepID=UPI00080AADB9|nr:transferrin-binding protein-like solute binding protein [Salipiger sp. CCB-MM3]ANT63033.1 hypothetical protein AYJ57_21400 [Salipiger sp. CCB-MM3]